MALRSIIEVTTYEWRSRIQGADADILSQRVVESCRIGNQTKVRSLKTLFEASDNQYVFHELGVTLASHEAGQLQPLRPEITQLTLCSSRLMLQCLEILKGRSRHV